MQGHYTQLRAFTCFLVLQRARSFIHGVNHISHFIWDRYSAGPLSTLFGGILHDHTMLWRVSERVWPNMPHVVTAKSPVCGPSTAGGRVGRGICLPLCLPSVSTVLLLMVYVTCASARMQVDADIGGTENYIVKTEVKSQTVDYYGGVPWTSKYVETSKIPTEFGHK